MKLPKLATFVSTPEQLQIAIEAGASHLILEDGKLAIRSFSDDYQTPGFQKITFLSTLAKQLNPDISLAVNVDIMAHDHHMPVVADLVNNCMFAAINEYRVQDPGVGLYIKSLHPQAEITLATETGNHNLASINTFGKWFSRQALGNELTHLEIYDMLAGGAEAFELQVHGPLLIQYSTRRYIAGFKPYRGESTRKIAQDLEYPGRFFPFYENPHGHFMYLYFDRSLIKTIPILMKLGLGRWIVDARGESLDYLNTALRTYLAAAQSYLNFPSEYEAKPEWIESLSAVGQRPLKAGFFLANKTDSEHRLAFKHLQDSRQYVGTVVDVIRGKWITIELEQQLTVPSRLSLFSPEGPQVTFEVAKMFSLGNEPLIESLNHRYVKVNWLKGAVPKSIVLTEDTAE